MKIVRLRVLPGRATIRVMPLAFRLLLGALLAWQACAACRHNWRRTIAGSEIPFATRFHDTTAAKLQRATGEHWPLLAAIRASSPPDTLVVTEIVSGDPSDYAPEQLLALMKKVGVTDQLRFLMFPEPRVLRVFEARRFVQRWTAEGGQAVLLWMPGGNGPPQGDDWLLLHRGPGFELWKYRTD